MNVVQCFYGIFYYALPNPHHGALGSQAHLDQYERFAHANSETTEDSVRSARRFVSSCTSLHKKINDLEPLAAHVKALRRMVEQLEAQASKIL